MSNKLTQRLKEPFPIDAHEFKPAAVAKGKSRALGLAYVDPRRYTMRLDEVGVDWTEDYEVTSTDDRIMVLCNLTIDGVTRANGGECDLRDDNAFTSAQAQAFKRACAKFGLGRYLYFMPKTWADYDKDSRSFSERGLRKLRHQLKTAIRDYQ